MPDQVDRNSKRSFVNGSILPDHHFEAKLFTTFLGDRCANETAAVCSHEVYDLGGDAFGSTNEVALILAVFVVDHHNDLAVTYVFNGIFYPIDLDHVRCSVFGVLNSFLTKSVSYPCCSILEESLWITLPNVNEIS